MQKPLGRLLLGGAGIVVATCAAYGPAMRAGFIWDDNVYVYRNPLLHDAAGLKHIWLAPTASPQYYPLVFTSFWIEHQLWGVRPLGYHLVNVLLHAATACLLWAVLRRLGVAGAGWAAAVFALHPVHVETVAWVTERKNVLSGLFYMAAALAYLRHERIGAGEREGQRGARWYGAALVLFVAALLSKSVTASLPAALVLVLWWKRGRVGAWDWLRLAPMFVLGACSGLATAWLETHHVGAQYVPWNLSFVDRCLVAGRAVWFYAWKLTWPRVLMFTYPRWEIDSSAAWPYLYPAAAVAVVAALFALRRRIGRGPLTAVLFFIGTLGPALGFLNVYPMVFSWVADHFQYLASIGIIALVCAAAARAAARASTRWTAALPLSSTLAVGVLLGLATKTWTQTHDYHDLETLWRNTLVRNPSAWMAHNNLADLLNAAGQLDEAAEHFEASARLRDDNAMAYHGLAEVRRKQGRLDEAKALLEKTLALLPDFATAHYTLGRVLEQEGKLEEALAEFAESARLSPSFSEARYSMALVLERLKRGTEALGCYDQALKTAPDADSQAQVHYSIAGLLRDAGDDAGALQHLASAAALREDYFDAHRAAGEILFAQQRYDQAAAAFGAAVALRPESAEPRMNQAAALSRAGRLREAADAFREAVRLAPNNAAAHFNYGQVLEALRRLDDAAAQYRAALRVDPRHTAARARLSAITSPAE